MTVTRRWRAAQQGVRNSYPPPIQPKHFIGELVLSRTVICMTQLTVLMGIAVVLLGVEVAGSFASLYVVGILGTALFLSIGFCLGSLAKTQQAIMAIGNLVTFPQVFLSGIFYPIETLPELIQPFAHLLPLSFVATGLREIIVNGAAIGDILPTIAGLTVWAVVALGLAIWLFVWKEVAA